MTGSLLFCKSNSILYRIWTETGLNISVWLLLTVTSNRLIYTVENRAVILLNNYNEKEPVNDALVMTAVKRPAWMSFQGQCSGLHNPEKAYVCNGDCAWWRGNWMKYAPASGLSLALFNVLASSSMLFLSPFIFQLPPTKNFLPLMIAKSVAFTRKQLTKETNGKTSRRRDSEEAQSAGVYITLAVSSAPRRFSLAQDNTPANMLSLIRRDTGAFTVLMFINYKSQISCALKMFYAVLSLMACLSS